MWVATTKTLRLCSARTQKTESEKPASTDRAHAANINSVYESHCVKHIYTWEFVISTIIQNSNMRLFITAKANRAEVTLTPTK